MEGNGKRKEDMAKIMINTSAIAPV